MNDQYRPDPPLSFDALAIKYGPALPGPTPSNVLVGTHQWARVLVDLGREQRRVEALSRVLERTAEALARLAPYLRDAEPRDALSRIDGDMRQAIDAVRWDGERDGG